jgi:hypothetical protein
MLGPPGQARRAVVLVTAGDPRSYGTPVSPDPRKPAACRAASGPEHRSRSRRPDRVHTHLPAGQRRTPAPEAALTPQSDPAQPPLSHAGSAGKPTCDPSSQLKPYVGDLRLSKLAGWTMAGEDSVTVGKPQVAGVV